MSISFRREENDIFWANIALSESEALSSGLTIQWPSDLFSIMRTSWKFIMTQKTMTMLTSESRNRIVGMSCWINWLSINMSIHKCYLAGHGQTTNQWPSELIEYFLNWKGKMIWRENMSILLPRTMRPNGHHVFDIPGSKWSRWFCIAFYFVKPMAMGWTPVCTWVSPAPRPPVLVGGQAESREPVPIGRRTFLVPALVPYPYPYERGIRAPLPSRPVIGPPLPFSSCDWSTSSFPSCDWQRASPKWNKNFLSPYERGIRAPLPSRPVIGCLFPSRPVIGPPLPSRPVIGCLSFVATNDRWLPFGPLAKRSFSLFVSVAGRDLCARDVPPGVENIALSSVLHHQCCCCVTAPSFLCVERPSYWSHDFRQWIAHRFGGRYWIIVGCCVLGCLSVDVWIVRVSHLNIYIYIYIYGNEYKMTMDISE